MGKLIGLAFILGALLIPIDAQHRSCPKSCKCTFGYRRMKQVQCENAPLLRDFEFNKLDSDIGILEISVDPSYKKGQHIEQLLPNFERFTQLERLVIR